MDNNIKAIAELYGYELVRKEKKMIVSDRTETKLEGSRIDLMAELTRIMSAFLSEGIASEDDLHEAVHMAAIPREELSKMAVEDMAELLAKLNKGK